MNPLRHEFISRCISSTPEFSSTHINGLETRTYLDVGCGGGIFTESAARLSTTLSVTGLDPTKEVIAEARRHARQDPGLNTLIKETGQEERRARKRLEYILGSIPNYEETGMQKRDGISTGMKDGNKGDTLGLEQAEIVSVFEVVEHVPNPSDFLAKCMSHVKPGGWLIGSTIARTWTSWLTTKLMAEDVLRLVPRGTHDWNKYIDPTEMEAFMNGKRRDGWDNWTVMGVIYIPGFGWKEVNGSENWGNYFFGMRRLP